VHGRLAKVTAAGAGKVSGPGSGLVACLRTKQNDSTDRDQFSGGFAADTVSEVAGGDALS
jgi:hypothetical protein